jgi:hypothetical protein
VLLNEKGLSALYQDIDPTLAPLYFGATVPQSWFSLRDPCQHAASEIQAPKIYVACKGDQAVPYEGQIKMATAAGAQIFNLECGHSPFLKKDEVLSIVELLEGVAED